MKKPTNCLELGRHWSFNLHQDPKRLGFVLARYRFAADLAARGRRILELGCSEGIGVPILAEKSADYTGVDFDRDAIGTADSHFSSDRCRFVAADFLGRRFGSFGTVLSLDVIEHISHEDELRFWQTVLDNLDDDGICIVGTPNSTSQAFASEASRLGHVNIFTEDRLKTTMEIFFQHVFIFSMNDEIVHSGFPSMAHYLLALACEKRTGR